MDTIAGLLRAARDRSGTAFDAPGRRTGYGFADLCTGAWKAGNLLRQYGVRAGTTVAVVVGPPSPAPGDEAGRLGTAPDPLLAALGAMVLGAAVDLEPDATPTAEALLAPSAWLDRYEVPAGCQLLGYGAAPNPPEVVYFERERWSENPVEPPEFADPESVALGGLTHAELVDRARRATEATGLAAGDRVAIRGRMTPETVPAGVLAPLLAGGTIVGGEGGAVDFTVDGAGRLVSA